MTEPSDLPTIPTSTPSNIELRIALATEEQTRTEIMDAIERMAQAVERSAASLRRELANSSDPAMKVERVQHELAWLFPNLGAHQLTHAAIAWTISKQAVTRLLTEGIEPA
jgi:hypothetical protein